LLKHPGTGKETSPNRGLDLWKRDWERQHESDETVRHRKGTGAQGRIQRNEASREQTRPEPPQTAAGTGTLSSSGGSFTTRNEMSPSADSQESDQATRPAPGQTPEQQAARAQEAVARFEAAAERLNGTSMLNGNRRIPAIGPDPQPPQEPESARGRVRQALTIIVTACARACPIPGGE